MDEVSSVSGKMSLSSTFFLPLCVSRCFNNFINNPKTILFLKTHIIISFSIAVHYIWVISKQDYGGLWINWRGWKRRERFGIGWLAVILLFCPLDITSWCCKPEVALGFLEFYSHSIYLFLFYSEQIFYFIILLIIF